MPIMNTTIAGGGTTPTGTLPITNNGTYDVTNYANADVQVPTTAPAHYVEKTVDANGKLINGASVINTSGVTDIGSYVLYGAYYNSIFPANTSVDLSSVTTISGLYACNSMFYASNIVSVDLSSLTTISGNNACQLMFCESRDLVSADLSSLATLSGTSVCTSMFNTCVSLINVDLSSLTTVGGFAPLSSMFHNCTSLTTIDLPSLTTMTTQVSASYAQMFYGCTNLESVKLGGLKAATFASAVNQIQYLFNNTAGSQAPNGCTVHFPSNFDPSDPNHTFDASTLAGYPTFGGDAQYIHVAFDLPATE